MVAFTSTEPHLHEWTNAATGRREVPLIDAERPAVWYCRQCGARVEVAAGGPLEDSELLEVVEPSLWEVAAAAVLVGVAFGAALVVGHVVAAFLEV